MLLLFDVGNTHTVIGLRREGRIEASFRVQSDMHRTVDEYALQIIALLSVEGVKPQDISACVISSVVPALDRVFSKLCDKYLAAKTLIVGPGVKTGVELKVDDPSSVGSDRVVNAVAVKELFSAPAIVIDFGTATTFDVVKADGAYHGGVIAPGLVLSAEALSMRAAKLPPVSLVMPDSLIGKNTVASMQSGIMFGYVALLEGLVDRLISELEGEVALIATGGLATLIVSQSSHVIKVVPDLTLQGLSLIADKNGLIA